MDRGEALKDYLMTASGARFIVFAAHIPNAEIETGYGIYVLNPITVIVILTTIVALALHRWLPKKRPRYLEIPLEIGSQTGRPGVKVRFPEPVIFEVKPLAHYKGYILPSILEKLPDLPNGQHQATVRQAGFSSQDHAFLAPSQALVNAQSSDDGTQK